MEGVYTHLVVNTRGLRMNSACFHNAKCTNPLYQCYSCESIFSNSVTVGLCRCMGQASNVSQLIRVSGCLLIPCT